MSRLSAIAAQRRHRTPPPQESQPPAVLTYRDQPNHLADAGGAYLVLPYGLLDRLSVDQQQQIVSIVEELARINSQWATNTTYQVLHWARVHPPFGILISAGVFGDGIEIRFTPGRLGGIHPDPRRVVQQRFGDHGLLAIGGVDLQRDLNTSGGNLQTLYARSHLVLASRAAGIEPPIDSVYPHLDDTAGLRDQARFARSLGFYGKSAIHPRQLDTLHQVFTPTADEIEWGQVRARRVRRRQRRRLRAAHRRIRRPPRRRPGPPPAGDRGFSGSGRQHPCTRVNSMTTTRDRGERRQPADGHAVCT